MKHVVTSILSEPREGLGMGSYIVLCYWAEGESTTNYDGTVDFCAYCGTIIDSHTQKSPDVSVIDGSVAN